MLLGMYNLLGCYVLRMWLVKERRDTKEILRCQSLWRPRMKWEDSTEINLKDIHYEEE
jgi:hypothetical protein